MISTDRHVHPSLLTESNPSTRLERILSVEKQKPSMDRRSLNAPSSWSVDGNSELEKKAAESDSKYGTMGVLNCVSWPRRSDGPVVD